MRTNWLKALHLDNTCLSDQNVSVVLNDFFGDYYYAKPSTGENFIIKGIVDGDETEVQKVDKGYRVRKTKYEDGVKRTSDDHLLFFKYVKEQDDTKQYIGGIESFKTYVDHFIYAKEDLHVKRRLCYTFENSVTKLYKEGTEEFIGYSTSSDIYARIQTDGVYIDLENKDKAFIPVPDLCTGVITQPNEDGSITSVNYDVINGKKSITRINDVINDISLVQYVIKSQEERIDMLKPFTKKKLKPQKIGFNIERNTQK